MKILLTIGENVLDGHFAVTFYHHEFLSVRFVEDYVG